MMVQRGTELGWAVEATARASGVSKRTVYKWVGRHRAGGLAALEDGASRPLRRPHRTKARLEKWIVELRSRRLSAPAIARKTGIARSTVGNVLRRHGVGRLRPLEEKPPIRRYERAMPGELVHVDTKALGRIGQIGHRITGIRQHRTRADPVLRTAV